MIVKTMRVAIYARCSTSRDQTPEVQLAELRRYCEARGWTVAHEIVDQGFSGKTDQRPGLKQLMALVRSREVDLVVVVKLDRLFRSLKHLVVTLQEFTDLGIEFVSLKDQIDVTTAAGRLLLHVIGAMAEFERELIVERVQAGIDYARSKGKKLGRPALNVDDQIRELRNQGMTYYEIQQELGVSKGVVYRALQPAPKSPAPELSTDNLVTGGSGG